MKRKNEECENSEPSNQQIDKRRRHNVEGRSTGVTTTRLRSAPITTSTQQSLVRHRTETAQPIAGRVWSCGNRKDVTLELLEDMGVNLIEDNSNEASAQEPVNSNPKINLNLILKNKDQNARKTQDSLPDFSISNEESLDPRKTSFKSFKDTRVPEHFTKYTRSRRDIAVVGQDKFNQMADEIILNIFKWLPKGSLSRSALVCKRWCRLVKDDSLWKRIDLGLRSIKPGIMAQVLSRGCQILRLTRSSLLSPVLPTQPYPSFSALKTFSDQAPCKLQYLDLSMATISPECLQALLNTCKLLKKLALENCELSDGVCSEIQRNGNLEILHLGLARGLTKVGVGSLTRGCLKLYELNISWTDLDEEGLKVLCSGAPKSLERLNLAGYRETLKDEHVSDLVNECPRLVELDVSDATLLTPLSLQSIIQRLPRLESLSTSRCYGITPSSYLLLAQCPSLLSLNVYGLLRDAALSELMDRLDGIQINKYPLSSIARPTIGIKRTSIWTLRVRD